MRGSALLLPMLALSLACASGAPPTPKVPSTAGEKRVSPARTGRTVGVMTFDVLGDARLRVDGKAIAEGIATSLAARQGVRIVETQPLDKLFEEQGLSATGAVADDGRRVGQLLQAELLVVGSAQVVEGRLRISARLVSSESGTSLAGLTSTGAEGDRFAVEEDIARRLHVCILDEHRCEVSP